jgi:hypothetical protein
MPEPRRRGTKRSPSCRRPAPSETAVSAGDFLFADELRAYLFSLIAVLALSACPIIDRKEVQEISATPGGVEFMALCEQGLACRQRVADIAHHCHQFEQNAQLAEDQLIERFLSGGGKVWFKFNCVR